ncbi:MAG: hypothetical protein AAGG69_00340 [Pseudomonadota bacterium]
MQIDARKVRQGNNGRRMVMVLLGSIMLAAGGYAIVEMTEDDQAAAEFEAWDGAPNEVETQE